MSKTITNKNSIRLIITLVSLSLLGLISTQVFWINNALKLADQQFDSRVTIALQGALDEYLQYFGNRAGTEHEGCLETCSINDSLFVNLVPHIMDSLLEIHFSYHGLAPDFEFFVVKCASNEVLYAKEGILNGKKNVTTHKISLSCLKHEESHHLEVKLDSKKKFVLVNTWSWLIASVVFLLIVAGSFALILLSLIRQKKIGVIKNDFINNMTHEFKTPIANINIAGEVLLRPDTKSKPERIDQYAKIILQENTRMRNQVERVLQVAARDREDLTIHAEMVNIHDLVKEAVDHICWKECENDTKVNYQFNSNNPNIWIDPLHFSSIIHNLIDNARKYSEGAPKIEITTRDAGNYTQIDFKDRGIGISKEAQRQIFEKFYRVPTGNIHNVKGFGLGLYYVKTMVEAMGGKIHIDSELGVGSTFSLSFPSKS